ncbi:ABC transporter ATP-binding protein [soil metagenome]
MSPPLLEVRDLALRFGGITALSGVSFDVGAGELFALIGPNGSGKTSVFNCLNGVYRPQSGTITFDGRPLVGARPTRTAEMGIARTFQNLALFVNLDVIDNLMLGRHHLIRTGFVTGALWLGPARREEVAHRERVEELVERLRLGPYRRQAVGTLPYGIQKRIELGRALAMEPRLLLLDEPTAGMNAQESLEMARTVLEIHDDADFAIIVVSHDVRMVMGIADRVMALHFGVALATGSPAEIQSDERVIDSYLGRRTTTTQKNG